LQKHAVHPQSLRKLLKKGSFIVDTLAGKAVFFTTGSGLSASELFDQLKRYFHRRSAHAIPDPQRIPE
jgi:hypothetical protein